MEIHQNAERNYSSIVHTIEETENVLSLEKQKQQRYEKDPVTFSKSLEITKKNILDYQSRLKGLYSDKSNYKSQMETAEQQIKQILE